MNSFKKIFKKLFSEQNTPIKNKPVIPEIKVILEPIVKSSFEEPAPPQKVNRTKEVLKEATAIKNNEGYAQSVSYLLEYISSEDLSMEDRIKVICKMIPYMDHKKSGFDSDYKASIYNKYVLDYLNNEPLNISEKLPLLQIYCQLLKNEGKSQDEIYQIALSYIKETSSLDYIKELVSIASLLENIAPQFKFKYFDENFNQVSKTMNEMRSINRYKFPIYNIYASLLLENNQFDYAFKVCRKTEHDILFKKTKDYEPDDYINEFQAFISVFLNSAIVGYKAKAYGMGTCLIYFLQCIMLEYCWRNISHYNTWKLFHDLGEDRTIEYKSNLLMYRLSETANWMSLTDDLKLRDLIPLYEHKQLNYDILITSMEDYVQNRLFKIYHDKFIWMNELREFAKSLLS